jgi:uncharacterized protein YwqG
MSDFDQQRADIQQHGLSTMADLVSLLRPLLLPATKLTPRKAQLPLAESQLRSHFGGLPYFETGEAWPTTETGQPLDFIMQVVASEGAELPDGIGLVQLFYSWEEFPWDTDQEGWLVKTYPAVSAERAQIIARPASLTEPVFCEIDFTPIQTLPGWDGIDDYPEGATATALASVLNEEEPWEAYRQAVEQLIGEQDFESTLGGYPAWVQGAANPVDEMGKNWPLLFQLDSEGAAGIMWGDTGLVYVFYDPEQAREFFFVLQCL